MDNNELLEKILAAIAQGNESLRTEFRESQEALKQDLIAQFVEAMNAQSQGLERMIDKRVSEAETRINLKLEHEIDHQLKNHTIRR